MIPSKLKRGDTIRVIAPAKSMALPWISSDIKQIILRRFKDMDLKVTFGEHVNEKNEVDSSPIDSRVEDIHDAFKDNSVKMIITIMGGFNSNELLPHLDYELIKKNPKILCGYSDITALENGIYAKTGLITYSGPHYFDFGEIKNFDYTLEGFKRCIFSSEPFELSSSDVWSDDRWGKNQENRIFEKNKGAYVLVEGVAEGTIIGANLVTFHSLSGTPYMPRPAGDVILFIEDDSDEDFDTINRTIYALTMQDWFKNVKGIVFGRFQPSSKITKEDLFRLVKSNASLKKMPIVADLDFGHTTPRFTFPIGGTAKIVAKKGIAKVTILNH